MGIEVAIVIAAIGRSLHRASPSFNGNGVHRKRVNRKHLVGKQNKIKAGLSQDRPALILWLDDNGRIKPFFISPFGIWLDRIEGDILVTLGVSAIVLIVIEGAIGL